MQKRKVIISLVIISVISVIAILYFIWGREVSVTGKTNVVNDEAETYISYSTDVTPVLNDCEYWINQYDDADEVIMDEEAIEQLNGKILGTEEIANDIWNTEDDAVRYAICVERADLKETPTTQVLSSDESDDYYDDNQLSVLRLNSPVLIDDETEDGSFYHVISYDYEGWAQAKCFAVCADEKEWMEAQQMKNFLVVTAPRVRLEQSDTELTMGSRLRLLTKKEASKVEVERSAYGCYVVEMPIRQGNGSYGVSYVTIPPDEDVSVGYLSYTVENELTLAGKFLGNAYGWGGMYESVDCSQLVQEVFACFGMFLPRDVSEQMQIPTDFTLFHEEMTEKERVSILEDQQPGCILMFNGHEMIYLGRYDEEYYVLSSVGTLAEPSETEAKEIRSVIINTLSVKRGNGNTWKDELVCAVTIR